MDIFIDSLFNNDKSVLLEVYNSDGSFSNNEKSDICTCLVKESN